jgi:hypothetical protein
MGITTFSGPIRAGNINTTTGTTLGTDVRNIGSVVMVQTVPVTQALTSTAFGTDIVLPANSHILNIQMLNTTAWDTTNTMSVGTTTTATELGALLAMTQGLISFTPGALAAAWDDTGTADKRVFLKSANTGIGVGTLTIRYIQAQDLQSSP